MRAGTLIKKHISIEEVCRLFLEGVEVETMEKMFNCSTTLITERLKAGNVSAETRRLLKYENAKKLINKRCGKLTVIEITTHPRFPTISKLKWKCKCECGNVYTYTDRNFPLYQISGCKECKIENLNHKGFKRYKEMTAYFLKKLTEDAEIRKIEYNITHQYIWKLFIKQNRKCALTGMDIRFTKFNTSDNKQYCRTASLDRIDSNKGYIKGNVQWVHKDINMLKLNWSQEEFISLCTKVANYHNKENNFENTRQFYIL